MYKQKLAGTTAFSGVQVLVIAVSILFFLSLGSANALEVKVIVPEELQSTLSEEEPVSLTLTISDYDDKCNISFETDLVRDGLNPFYVFPDLDIRGDKNFIEIVPPPQEEIKVQIFGRALSANEVTEEKNCYGLKIVKYDPGPYRYFEIEPVNAEGEIEEEKVIGSPEMFMVKVKAIEEFNNKLEKIEWNKLDHLKRFAEDLFFEKGLVNEAGILADELAKIPKLPKYIIEIILLSCIVVGIVSGFFSFVIGYRRGKKKGGRKND